MSTTQDLHAAASHSAGKQGEVLLTPKEAARFVRLSESFFGQGAGRRATISKTLQGGAVFEVRPRSLVESLR